MQLNIKYFGMLTEVTTCNEEDINFKGGTVSDLLEVLFSRYPSLKSKTFRVAQNNNLSPNECEVSANKIALLPSFAGG
tara:strand:+ start:210 stop:443 length:234 start_codon:yes stop_codon:yes gene_type:complete